MKRSLVLIALIVACRREQTVVEQQPQQPPKVTETVVGEKTNVANADVKNVMPLVAPVAKKCETGTQLDAQGHVSAKAASIASNTPLYLTIWLSESPEELQVSMRVRDLDQDEVASVTKPAKGANVITLKLDQKLDPGTYRVEGVWGGNVACEQEIEIVAR